MSESEPVPSVADQSEQGDKVSHKEQTQEASPGPDNVTEETQEASPGPDDVTAVTQEASAGPDNVTEGTQEASSGPDNVTEETREASPGPDNVTEVTQEARPGPDNVTKAAEKVEESHNGDAKVVIITGANTGIGLVAAELLAKDGYEVIMACRSEEKANKAVAQVQKTVPGAKVSFMKLDLNSLKSVREFSDAFHATGKPLHVLCNNAGLTTGFSSKQRLETEEGFEMTFGVNHLGHFLLTNLLLDVLKKTAAACGEVRIVSTSSGLHDPENPGGKRGFIPATGLGRNETIMTKISMTFVVPLLKLFGVTRTIKHGGGMIHYVATSPEFKDVTGKHATDFKMADSSKESRDPDVGKKLWDISADLVKYETAKAL